MSAGKRAAFFALSLLLALLAAEALLRAFYPLLADYHTETWRYAAALKRPTDRPGLPFEHVPGAAGVFYGVEIRTNNAGWRSATPAVLEKPAGVKRVLLLGDSQALGWGVAEEDTFARRLERRLNEEGPVEVMNAGVGNFNLAAMAAKLKEDLAYRPDLVVLALAVNDAEVLEPVGRAKFSLLSRSYLYGVLWSRFTVLRYRLSAGESYRSYYPALYAPGAPGLAAYETAARDILAETAARGLPLVVLSVPEFRSLGDNAFAPIVEGQKRLFAGAAAFVDPAPLFAGARPETVCVSAEDPHPNAFAHGVLADALFPAVRARLGGFTAAAQEDKI